MPAGGERGSVLMLMPAAVLVVIVLAALAVDAAVVFLAEREMADAAAAAANDGAVAALHEGAFYECGELRIDAARAEQVAAEAFATRQAGYLSPLGTPSVEVGSGPDGRQAVVTVSAAATVELVFSKAVPGAPDARAVQATARVSARQDPALAAGAAEGC